MTAKYINSPGDISSIANLEMGNNSSIAQYIAPFAKNTTALISNIESKTGLLNCNDDYFLPFTVNNTEFNNSYTCSPYTAYIPYGIQEANNLDNQLIRWVCQNTLPFLEQYLIRQKINKNIHINNWLLSTNLYPRDIETINISDLIESTVSVYPDHAIILRSLNQYTNANLMQVLLSHNFLLVPSRQIYIQDLSLSNYAQKRDVKNDVKLLKNTTYEYVQENELASETHRIIDLYNQLYLRKYSIHNPHFTVEFVKNALKNPLFTFEGFRNEQGVLDGVSCRFELDDIMTVPIIGYEMQRPLSDGLYRLLVISRMIHAQSNGLIINASSGAPGFKRLRGAVPFIEYSAIYCKHLSQGRQRMWHVLQKILTSLVVPMMKKLKL